MCTAASYKTKDFYFGRTLDYYFSYGEETAVTPRNYPFNFRLAGEMKNHYALIGTAHIAQGYPLYYDAVNEKGLAMAGLNFVGNAVYKKPESGRDNIAQFELIPWILGQCGRLSEAKELLSKINIVDTSFSVDMKAAQLHWLIADRDGAVTVEATADGVHIYDNPVGVMTNNPPFPEQLFNLGRYMKLSPKPPVNLFSDKLSLKPCSLGEGALGLPGDLSSQSRFVRASFVKLNSRSGESEVESVSQLFHILGSVSQPRGSSETEDGQLEATIYTSCCNCRTGVYYYTAYDNHQITAVDMRRENLDGAEVVSYPHISNENINYQN